MLSAELSAAATTLYTLCLVSAAVEALLEDSDLAAPVRGACALAAALGAARMIGKLLS